MHSWIKLVGAHQCTKCGVVKTRTTVNRESVITYTFKDGSSVEGFTSPTCKEANLKQLR